MSIWKRENDQCKNCAHEGGCNVVVGVDNEGSIEYTYEFLCTTGNITNCDTECLEFQEDLK